MIELYTGFNGSGKTLSIVHRLLGLYQRWEKYPEEARAVYVWGVHGLTLPCLQIPHTTQTIRGVSYPVPLWDEMPEGSLVIIDECQKMFPVRSSQSASPDHILWFTEHRRLGFDFWLASQNPKFIDPMVRALIARHQHFRRIFGSSQSIVYEWDACSDNLGGFKNAVTSYFRFPREVYKYYKSAEIHTKQSFKKPYWLAVPVIGLVLGLIAWPKAYDILHNGIHHAPAPSIASDQSKPLLDGLKPASYKLPPAASPSSSDDALPSLKPEPKEKPFSVEASKCEPGAYGDNCTDVHLSLAQLDVQRKSEQVLSLLVERRASTVGF